jgi:hypothetical protein
MLQPGYYRAIVDHVWPREGQHGEYWEWSFCIVGERYPLKASTSSNVKNENTQQYLRAVRGYIDLDEEFFASDLGGESCTLRVGTTQKNGRTYNTVEDVI